MLGILGIEDGLISLVYLLCILSSLLCVIYGLVTWNRGGDEIEPEDLKWATEEKKVEEEI